MKTEQSPHKKAVLEAQLEQGMVLIALDARVPEVDVPAHLGPDLQLRLNLSYRFGLPMELTDWGVEATLTFGGVPHPCRVPWKAIFLIVSHVSGEPTLFPEDVPAELTAQAAEDDPDAGVKSPVAPASAPRAVAAAHKEAPNRPRLTLVSSQEKTEEAPSHESSHSPEPSPTPAPKGRAHLRLVK